MNCKISNNIIKTLPLTMRDDIMSIVKSMRKPDYMEFPYFAVIPIIKVGNEIRMFYSKLTGISIKGAIISTSGGITNNILNFRFPVPETIANIIGYNIIDKSNINDAMKKMSKFDYRDVHNWIYIKGYDIVDLKLAEIISVIKGSGININNIRFILNNVFSMAIEYKMWMYDEIQNKVIYPIDINIDSIRNNRFIDITDTPQTEKNVFRLTVGANVNKGKAIDGKYMISRIHAECPVPDKIAPNRLVVQRALTQAMKLMNPQNPIVVSGIERIGVDSLNMLSARMEYRALTHEDGIVISKSAAKRFTAFSVHLDRIDGTKDDVIVKPVIGDREFIMNRFVEILYTMRNTDAVIKNNSVIAINKFGRKTRSTVKSHAIVSGVIEINGKVFVESISVHRLKIGDKIMDMHGNKGVISEIIPDSQMPKLVINGKVTNIDIIFPPYTVKRGTPSREIEEKVSMEYIKNADVMFDDGSSDDIHIVDIINNIKDGYAITETIEAYKEIYSGSNIELVYVPGHGFYEVPVGIIRVARLNHIAEAKLSYYSDIFYNSTGKQIRKGYSMADNMFHLILNKCNNTLMDISEDMNISGMENILTSIGYKMTNRGTVDIRDGRISLTKDELSRIDHILINNPDFERIVKPDTVNDILKNTIADPDLSNKFMAIKIPDGMSGDISVDRLNRKVVGGQYIIIPPTETYILYDGTVTINNIQSVIRRILLQIRNSESDLARDNVMRLISVLYTMISNMMSRKSGLLRQATFPRVKFTGYGVIVPNIDIHPDEILIPYRMMKDMSYKFSSEMREMYNIDQTMNLEQMQINVKGYCLATRFPAHRERNAIALKIRIWNEFAIGIHPSIIAIQDGDFDGDMEMIFLPRSKASMMELKNAFGLDSMIKKGIKFDRGRALRVLPNNIEYNTNRIKQYMYKSTGLLDNRERDERYKTLIKGLDIEYNTDTYDMFKKAVDDISFMKRGAANAGNIGMTLRGLATTVNEMRMANEVYHILAQTALDGKNGQGDKDLVNILCNAIRFGYINDIEKYGTKVFDEKLIRYIMRQMTHENRVIGIARKFAQLHPIGHITTTGGARDLGKETDIDGVYERLYRLALNRLYTIKRNRESAVAQ